MSNLKANHRSGNHRWKSALVAGGSAMLTLLVILHNIGGIDSFIDLIFTIFPLFLMISLLAGFAGLFVSKFRLRWSVLIGIGIGSGAALAIIANAVSNI